ncbi:MAG TPA: S1/P1 nuclease, partial [Chitinophagaceae bacterium]|nr:S1/P1 nuclease [Chitinophagaceae bacterium]
KEILGNESLAIASNWADFIKSDSTFNYLNSWHYINIKQGLNYTEFSNYLQKDTATDAYTRLNFLIGELKNKQLPLEKKQIYLRLLIHIAGDIHQPLHVGRLEDLGGNKIKISWFNEQTNLHSLWDDKIIELQKLSYTEYVASINHTNKSQRIQWQQQPLSKWFFESYEIAGKIYNGITQPEQKLGYRYNFENIETLNLQLLKGGVRLAGLLNEIFN